MKWGPISSLRVGEKLRCCNALVLNPRQSGDEDEWLRVRSEELYPDAQTTHISVGFKSHLASHGHYTPRARVPTVYAQRHAFPRPVLYAPQGQAPLSQLRSDMRQCNPWHARTRYTKQAFCKSRHATHTRAVAIASRPAHRHANARAGFISAGYGPVRTAVGRRRTRLQAACDGKTATGFKPP